MLHLNISDLEYSTPDNPIGKYGYQINLLYTNAAIISETRNAFFSSKQNIANLPFNVINSHIFDM